MLVWIAVAHALGIAIAAFGATPVWGAFALAGVGLAFGVARRGRLAAALTLALAAGLLAQSGRLADARRAAVPAPRIVDVEGVVARRASALDPRWIDLERLRGDGVPRRVRLFAGSSGELDDWLPGDRLRARVRVAALHAARNPGASPERLQRAGLGARASLLHPALAVAREPAGGGLRRLQLWRRRAARAFNEAGRGAELLRALALGDRGALSPGARDAFARLGLAHWLAVSGLHLSAVAAAAHAITAALLRRSARLAARWDTRRVALGPALAIALGYAAIAGWGVPVQRALALLVAASFALFRDRPQRAAAPLAAAALWILAGSPQALFEAGAQLSFVAVAALVWASRRSPAERRGAIEGALRHSATAIVATAPLVAWHAFGASPVALAANLVALPWLAGAVLPAALLSAAAAIAEVPGHEVAIALAAGMCAEGIAWFEAAADALPALSRGSPSLGWQLAISALAAFGLALRSTAQRAAVALLLAVVIAAAPAADWDPPPPRLVVLEVGQGDAVVLQGRRATLLVDAGGAHADWDAGRQRVLPALRALGIERIDLAIATHADLDHRGGLPSVLASLPVGELWLPWGSAEERDFAALRAAARANGTRLREAGRGSPLRRIGDLEIEPLWPPRSGAGGRNARSLVVRASLRGGGSRVLLPGDLDAPAEAALLAREPELRAEVLLLPHHGSRTSSSAAFLDAVAPRLAIVSAPCRSRFGMPHRDVTTRLAERAIAWAWTGRDGAIRVALDADPVALGTGSRLRCGRR